MAGLTYEERLSVPTSKTKIELFSKTGVLIATRYNRIVIGGRGPYIEFKQKHLIMSEFKIPQSEIWRQDSDNAYYIEHRSIHDNIKLYEQLKLVNYADYKIGFYYISPFELNTINGSIIEPIRRKK